MPKACLCNTNFNLSKQLVKKLKFLWAVDTYIKDAKREGFNDVAELWEKIKADEERHSELIKEKLINAFKVGKL